MLGPGAENNHARPYQNRYNEFRSQDVALIGVSPDPVDELTQSVAAEDLEFTLQSDEDGTVTVRVLRQTGVRQKDVGNSAPQHASHRTEWTDQTDIRERLSARTPTEGAGGHGGAGRMTRSRQ